MIQFCKTLQCIHIDTFFYKGYNRNYSRGGKIKIIISLS